MPPYIIERQQVAAKIEGTEGTDAVPTATDLVHPAFDIEWTPTVEMNERNNLQPSFSRITQIAGERSASISFATELKGSGTAGTAPVNLSAALRACGFAETIVAATSVTYAPASESVPSVTIEVREIATDGTAKIKKILGARGTVSFEAQKGNIVLASFEFTGRYIEPTEGVALVTPAPTPNPVPFLSAGLTVQGVATLKAQTVSLDIGNSVSLRNDVNEASGNFSAVIVGRAPVGSIDPEQEDIATINFFANWTGNVEGILQYVLGATAGNITTVNAPKVQITGLSEGDRDGMRIESLDLQLSQSAAIGDDELTFVFT